MSAKPAWAISEVSSKGKSERTHVNRPTRKTSPRLLLDQWGGSVYKGIYCPEFNPYTHMVEEPILANFILISARSASSHTHTQWINVTNRYLNRVYLKKSTGYSEQHAFKPITEVAEAGRSVNLMPAWSTQWNSVSKLFGWLGFLR